MIGTTEIKSKGRNHYSHAKADAKKDRRRREAEARGREYAGLSITDRIDLAKSRRGESKREVARLEKLLATQKAPAVKKAPLTPSQKLDKTVQHIQAVVETLPKTEKRKGVVKKG